MRGGPPHLDAYVADLIAAGVALRGLSAAQTPLESLFFMLTESTPEAAPAAAELTGTRR